MQLIVSVAAGEEASSLSMRQRMMAAELEMPQAIVLQSAAISSDPFDASFADDTQAYAGNSEQASRSDPLDDRETVQAMRAAKDEMRWCTLPWFLLAFTAGKLCETAQAMVEYPERWTKSRWAMDDPEYAEKYAHGAAKHDILGSLSRRSMLASSTGPVAGTYR